MNTPTKLTPEEAAKLLRLWDTSLRSRAHDFDMSNSEIHKATLEDVLGAWEAMRPRTAGDLPEWRDPNIDPPTEADLDGDGEVAVKKKDGSVFCTDPRGILEGCMWMCLYHLAALPRKQYPPLPREVPVDLEKERPLFEAWAHEIGGDLHRDGRGRDSYRDPHTQTRWEIWLKSAAAAR